MCCVRVCGFGVTKGGGSEPSEPNILPVPVLPFHRNPHPALRYYKFKPCALHAKGRPTTVRKTTRFIVELGQRCILLIISLTTSHWSLKSRSFSERPLSYSYPPRATNFEGRHFSLVCFCFIITAYSCFHLYYIFFYYQLCNRKKTSNEN